MIVSFTCHFMAALCDLSYQLRSCLRYTTEDEESRSHTEFVEQVESLAGTELEPLLKAMPPATVDDVLEWRQVVVIFQDHGKDVASGTHGRSAVRQGMIPGEQRCNLILCFDFSNQQEAE
jgi:hypothetical protein